ncbi:hypothetical protein, partial [Streptomyces sp. SID5789]|uniref:hypothetical protein n=1 Tax=Streptomyces sp. SID5789 TaxID=2690310 RepID=UPI001F4291B4
MRDTAVGGVGGTRRSAGAGQTRLPQQVPALPQIEDHIAEEEGVLKRRVRGVLKRRVRGVLKRRVRAGPVM